MKISRTLTYDRLSRQQKKIVEFLKDLSLQEPENIEVVVDEQLEQVEVNFEPSLQFDLWQIVRKYVAAEDDGSPSIYVASLADYLAGRHHGLYVDCVVDDQADILFVISVMLAFSIERVAEDWEIHDRENFYNYEVKDLEQLRIVANTLYCKCNSGEEEALISFLDTLKAQGCNWEPSDEDDLYSTFENAYLGSFSSEVDFVERADYLADRYSWDKFEKDYPLFSQCIDWNALADRIFDGDDLVTANNGNGIFVFDISGV